VRDTARPNILIVIVDQLRYREMKYGYNLSTVMPNITKLRAQSIEFRNCYAAATACTPSRACLLTGLYAPQTCAFLTEVRDTTPVLVPTYSGSPAAFTGFPTFGSYLRRKGYSTHWFGKWHLSDYSARSTTDLTPYGFQNVMLPSPNG